MSRPAREQFTRLALARLEEEIDDQRWRDLVAEHGPALEAELGSHQRLGAAIGALPHPPAAARLNEAILARIPWRDAPAAPSPAAASAHASAAATAATRLRRPSLVGAAALLAACVALAMILDHALAEPPSLPPPVHQFDALAQHAPAEVDGSDNKDEALAVRERDDVERGTMPQAARRPADRQLQFGAARKGVGDDQPASTELLRLDDAAAPRVAAAEPSLARNAMMRSSTEAPAAAPAPAASASAAAAAPDAIRSPGGPSVASSTPLPAAAQEEAAAMAPAAMPAPAAMAASGTPPATLALPMAPAQSATTPTVGSNAAPSPLPQLRLLLALSLRPGLTAEVRIEDAEPGLLPRGALRLVGLDGRGAVVWHLPGTFPPQDISLTGAPWMLTLAIPGPLPAQVATLQIRALAASSPAIDPSSAQPVAPSAGGAGR